MHPGKTEFLHADDSFRKCPGSKRHPSATEVLTYKFDFSTFFFFKSSIKTTDNLLCKTWGEERSREFMAVSDMEFDEKAQVG